MSKSAGFWIASALLLALLVAGKVLYPKYLQVKAMGGSPGPAVAPGGIGPEAPGQGPGASGAPGGAGRGSPGTKGGGPAMPVTARILQPERMENSLTSSGNVLANEEVEIRSEIQGKISRIAFKEGARVRKGDLLVKIDDDELQAKVLQAQSGSKLAEDNEYRMRMQLKIEAVSQKDYDQALNELNGAKAQAQLLRAQLAKTELRAPFGGVVGLKQVSEGAYVSPSTLITTLQEIDPVKVDFTVPGRYSPWVKPGQAVTFTVQGSEQRHNGRVYAVDPRIDPATRTLRLRALCPNPGGAILPGSFATVDIPLQIVEAALLVPAQALSVGARGASVFLYRGGKAEVRPVQAGLRTDSSVQITGGLKAGDTVIVSGAVTIRPGAPVSLSRID